eukprot:gnl/Chilomastix_cuspidata/2321.p2 GENE.gnl/Chilomastix_cuspidata/2321~~gnl/Chilomastix_cuspidata/2321.p2  ORF type:complete len:282 (+),score=101.17 gnl/Chilomastix_cuspidata/2321:51-848(+)
MEPIPVVLDKTNPIHILHFQNNTQVTIFDRSSEFVWHGEVYILETTSLSKVCLKYTSADGKVHERFAGVSSSGRNEFALTVDPANNRLIARPVRHQFTLEPLFSEISDEGSVEDFKENSKEASSSSTRDDTSFDESEDIELVRDTAPRVGKMQAKLIKQQPTGIARGVHRPFDDDGGEPAKHAPNLNHAEVAEELLNHITLNGVDQSLALSEVMDWGIRFCLPRIGEPELTDHITKVLTQEFEQILTELCDAGRIVISGNYVRML